MSWPAIYLIIGFVLGTLIIIIGEFSPEFWPEFSSFITEEDAVPVAAAATFIMVLWPAILLIACLMTPYILFMAISLLCKYLKNRKTTKTLKEWLCD